MLKECGLHLRLSMKKFRIERMDIRRCETWARRRQPRRDAGNGRPRRRHGASGASEDGKAGSGLQSNVRSALLGMTPASFRDVGRAHRIDSRERSRCVRRRDPRPRWRYIRVYGHYWTAAKGILRNSWRKCSLRKCRVMLRMLGWSLDPDVVEGEDAVGNSRTVLSLSPPASTYAPAIRQRYACTSVQTNSCRAENRARRNLTVRFDFAAATCLR
jgi:hypothetical protein